MWTSVARRRIAITRAKASFLRKFSTKDDTIKEMSHQLEPYSKKLTLIGGALVVMGLGGAISYVNGLKREIAVSKIEAEKQIEIMKEITAKQIVRAERGTMEKFLKFGYAEEFDRCQKAVGVYKPEDSDLTNRSEKSCME